MEVGVHYYDLTEGLVSRYGRSLISPLPGDPEFSAAPKPEGKAPVSSGLSCCSHPTADNSAVAPTPADEDLFIHPRFSVMHSSVVCYGFEYYFEGGIGRAPKGCTRFGSQYDYVVVAHSSTKRQDEFETWLKEASHGRFGFPMYSATEHNCHQFTEAALRFLTDDQHGIPRHIWDNVTRIVRSPLLRAFVPLSSRLICGTLKQASRPIQAHLLDLGHGVLRLRQAADMANVASLPSKVAFLFGCSSSPQAEITLKAGFLGCVDRDTDPEPPTASEALNIKRLCMQLVQDGPESTLDPTCVLDAVNSVARLMDFRHSFALSDPLNALRLFILHDTALSYTISNPRIITTLLRVVRDFADLPGETKVAMVRLLCNLASSPAGAKLLVNDVRVQHWLYVAGCALLDVDPTITFHGACLLYNIALSITVISTNSVENIFHSQNSAHIENWVTVALYHLSSSRSTPAVVVRILMALTLMCEVSPSVASHINEHSLSPNVDALLALFPKNDTEGEDGGSKVPEAQEIRSLLCVLNAFFFMAEGGVGDDDHASSHS